MIQTVEPLRETNPKAADFLENWQNKFARDFDFSKKSDQADFVEAMTTMAGFLTTSKDANLKITVGSDGVSALICQSSPNRSQKSIEI